MVEIVEQDSARVVTRLIGHTPMQTPGLVMVALIRIEKVRAGFSKIPSNLANIIFTQLMLQRETEN